MKKLNVFVMMACAIGMMATSCVKENETANSGKKQEKTATAKKMSNICQKTFSDFSGNYLFFSKVGHLASSCSGNCTTIGGVRKHVNCQGYGSICEARASISVSNIDPGNSENIYYNAIGLDDYEPTDDTTFNMPDRSYYIENDSFENGYIYLRGVL